MTDTPNRPPLWETMAEACAAHPQGVVDLRPAAVAAMIDALRDWLTPEEAEPTGMRPCGDTYSAQSIKRGQRQCLRALLTAEADRAERGEGA